MDISMESADPVFSEIVLQNRQLGAKILGDHKPTVLLLRPPQALPQGLRADFLLVGASPKLFIYESTHRGAYASWILMRRVSVWEPVHATTNRPVSDAPRR